MLIAFYCLRCGDLAELLCEKSCTKSSPVAVHKKGKELLKAIYGQLIEKIVIIALLLLASSTQVCFHNL